MVSVDEDANSTIIKNSRNSNSVLLSQNQQQNFFVEALSVLSCRFLLPLLSKYGVMGLILKRFHPFGPLRKSFVLLVARILVGLVLLIKGVLFVSNSEQLEQMILSSRFADGVRFLTAYITFAHLFGGVFIIIGLLTRFAALLQIPVLLGAIFFTLPWQVDITGIEELILSIIVLGLLVFILWKGSGEISMEHYLKKHLL